MPLLVDKTARLSNTGAVQLAGANLHGPSHAISTAAAKSLDSSLGSHVFKGKMA